jgi:hypothetical protein
MGLTNKSVLILWARRVVGDFLSLERCCNMTWPQHLVVEYLFCISFYVCYNLNHVLCLMICH